MRPTPPISPASALLVAALAAGCGAAPRTTTHDMTDATHATGAAEPAAPALPELDLAAPDDFATATFALG